MNEHLLQYIWLHRLFNTKDLSTEDHQSITILHQGTHNKNQGPDFLHARIYIGGIELVGSIEIHIKTSLWYRHSHSGDKHYGNVILHVVWEHDMPFDKTIPILSLSGRVPLQVIKQYDSLISTEDVIPCAGRISSVSSLVISMWKERMFAERLNAKTEQLQALISGNQHHEEEVFWRMIFRAMGMPVNSDAFEAIFLNLPFKVWIQSASRVQVVESLLMGQAHLLNDSLEDPYLVMLSREFEFLKRKYHIGDVALLLSNLRMRPAHFPLLRLAQLASLLHLHPDLYAKMMRADNVAEMRKLLMVTPNDFWHVHYTFKEKTYYQEKPIGVQMAEVILINVVLPFRYLLATQKRNIPAQLKVMEYFTTIKAERHQITKRWQQLGIVAENAFDTQALLHLKKNYCEQKRCLNCAIGRAILLPE